MPLSPKGFPVLLSFDLDAETMWTARDPKNAERPIVMPRDREEMRVICDQCVSEHTWAQGASRDEVRFTARLPLDQSDAWVLCDRGHRNLVVREGAERTANFGA